ncbi:MAG TPA: DUF2125 domain-containing protein [Acetobacteraceae bacterium]|nr:DUF2125 domain-containing protein [Acetobacteraceae bacterium]
MRRSLRRRLLALVVLTPVLAVGVEAVIWLVAARQLEAGFQSWIAARRSDGWQIASGRERLGGWPFSATVTATGFAISGGQNLIPDGLAWRTRQLALRVDLLAPDKLLIRSAGTEHFRIAGSPEIALAARQVEAVVVPVGASPGGPDQIDISADGVRLGASSLDPDLIRADSLAISANFEQPAGEASEVSTDAGTDASSETSGMARSEVSLHLQATKVTVAHAKLPALGPDIALVSLSATMSGPLPSGPAWTVGLGAWRDGGGMLIVRDFSAVWGPLAVGAAGRLALDRAMQPAGEGTARVVGYAATLDAMVADGSIGHGAATAAKAVLMLLARPSNTAGAPPEVDVPLRLEDRTLSVGIIPLLKLPVVSWPSAPR